MERPPHGLGLEGVLNPGETLPPRIDEPKQTYKSFKKKYRKMRFKFDEAMRQSNDYCLLEQQANETAKRLARENDQILNLLLDTNHCPQIPADKRIDLGVYKPMRGAQAADGLFSIFTADERSRLVGIAPTPDVNRVHNKVLLVTDQRDRDRMELRPGKSLAQLEETTHHVTTASLMLPQELLNTLEPLEGYTAPITYLTPDQIDEYLDDIDAGRTTTRMPSSPHQELQHRNPHSVYNWLRRNEPRVFLQDGEGSEKSQGKPGSLRGAGKRASMPHPSKPDALEIVEENGLGYDPTIAGLEPANKGKRKREDDGGYHPKLGAPHGKAKKPKRARKKPEGLSDTTNSSGSKKGKGKAKVASPVGEEPESAGAAEPASHPPGS